MISGQLTIQDKLVWLIYMNFYCRLTVFHQMLSKIQPHFITIPGRSGLRDVPHLSTPSSEILIQSESRLAHDLAVLTLWELSLIHI